VAYPEDLAQTQGFTLGRPVDFTVSPDGQRVASASADESVFLWQAFASPEMLCDKFTANMSRRHWSEWVSPGHRLYGALPKATHRIRLSE